MGSRTLAEVFLKPMKPIKIQRPLQGHFDEALGLTPGVTQAPNGDYLAKILTNHPTHKAWVLHAAQQEAKNLENLASANGMARASTLDDLERQLGFDPMLLIDVSSPKGGPMFPGALKLLSAAEGIPSWFYELLTSHVMPCPHCGADMMKETVPWWEAQQVSLATPEYEFAERLLVAVTAGRHLARIADSRDERRSSGARKDAALAEPHPIRQWLNQVRDAYGVASLSALDRELARRDVRDKDKLFSARRLRDWSRGTEFMPLDSGTRLVERLPNVGELRHALVVARTLTLVEEFLVAADRNEQGVNCQQARAIVNARLKVLQDRLALGGRHVNVVPAGT